MAPPCPSKFYCLLFLKPLGPSRSWGFLRVWGGSGLLGPFGGLLCTRFLFVAGRPGVLSWRFSGIREFGVLAFCPRTKFPLLVPATWGFTKPLLQKPGIWCRFLSRKCQRTQSLPPNPAKAQVAKNAVRLLALKASGRFQHFTLHAVRCLEM